MIRIVDILKNSGGHEDESKPAKAAPPQPAVPQPDGLLAAEELVKLYAGLFSALRPPMRLEAVRTAVADLVIQLRRKNPRLLPVLEQQKTDATYLHAARMLVHAVMIGLDANYSDEKLEELALVALASGLEMGGLSIQELLPSRDDRAYNDIVNLAEIYDRTKRA